MRDVSFPYEDSLCPHVIGLDVCLVAYHFAGPGSLHYSAVIIKCVLDAVPPVVINENGVVVNHCEIMHSVSFIRGVFRSLGEE
jgi:hypothetical protein